MLGASVQSVVEPKIPIFVTNWFSVDISAANLFSHNTTHKQFLVILTCLSCSILHYFCYSHELGVLANLIFHILIIIFVCVSATPQPTLSPNNWYVSLAGFRSGICGNTPDKPCRDLAHVISIAQDYDNIYVDGRPSPHQSLSDQIYSLCHNREFNLQSYLLKKSLNIIGINGTPTIGCNSQYDMHSWNNNNSIILSSHHTEHSNCTVLLSNLYLQDGIVPLGNCTVVVKDMIFQNASIKTSIPCHFLDLRIYNSKFSGGHNCDDNGTCGHNKLNKVYTA